jgi:hypothetical protein
LEDYATKRICCFDLLTIEILGSKEAIPAVLDRVIGGSLHLDKASRVGQHLLSIVDAKTRPSQDHRARKQPGKDSSLKMLRGLDTVAHVKVVRRSIVERIGLSPRSHIGCLNLAQLSAKGHRLGIRYP